MSILAVLLSAAGGCGKVSEASGSTAAQAMPASERPAANAAPVPSMENANYRAEIRSIAPCKKQETCGAEVVVQAKGEYHINDKYPYKFKLDDPPAGLKYPKPVIGKDDLTMDEKRVVMKVPFISDASGEKKVGGTLSLSVCSAANCLMDRQPLEVTVKVE